MTFPAIFSITRYPMGVYEVQVRFMRKDGLLRSVEGEKQRRSRIPQRRPWGTIGPVHPIRQRARRSGGHRKADGYGRTVAAVIQTKERSEKEYKDLIHRLNRIEGQMRGIRGMVEKNCYCPDILVQVAAANAALNSFNKVLLGEPYPYLRGGGYPGRKG